jgi:hypothetical protein
MDNLFPYTSGITNQKLLYSELAEQTRANFNAMALPCQYVNIQADDPSDTIAEMYCRVNTAATKLKPGELYKAYGYKDDIWEIEIAKGMIGPPWSPAPASDASDLRDKWHFGVGELSETTRCESLSCLMAFILSAKTSEFVRLFSDFKRNKLVLSRSGDDADSEQRAMVFSRLKVLTTILAEIRAEPGGFDLPIQSGRPASYMIAPIWMLICEGLLTPVLRSTVIRFYRTQAADDEVFIGYLDWLRGHKMPARKAAKLAYEHILETAGDLP